MKTTAMASIIGHAYQGIVLIVDCSPATCELCRNHLKPEGLRVLFAENSRQGINVTRRILPDVLLLNLMMPDMDGFQIIEQLKAEPVTRDIAILVHALPEDASAVEKALRLGADDFLTKPSNAAELIVRIHKLLRFKQTREALRSPAEDLLRSQLAITRALKKWEQEAAAFRKQCETILINLLGEAGGADGVESQARNSAELVGELLERAFNLKSGHDVLH